MTQSGHATLRDQSRLRRVQALGENVSSTDMKIEINIALAINCSIAIALSVRRAHTWVMGEQCLALWCP